VPAGDYPLGTLLVNTLGSFLLALVTFAGADSATLLFVGTGACGAFTTYSSFSVETVRLWEAGERPAAVGYAAGSLAAALVGVGLGYGVAVRWGLA
jgi:CrcB protein